MNRCVSGYCHLYDFAQWLCKENTKDSQRRDCIGIEKNEGDRMNLEQQAIGSAFDDFLEEEDLLSEVEALAAKRVIAYQIAESMKQKNMTKTEMAKRMGTSRSSLNRLLDPLNTSVSLATIESAVSALGKRLRIQIV